MTIRGQITQRIDAAIRRHAPSGRPPLTVPGRRVYILPTGTGWLFAILLVTMLAGATNYGNNLAFVLTFWLAATALVSMHRTHRNLAGLQIASIRSVPVFAGDPALFDIHLATDARLARRGLRVATADTVASAAVTVSREATVQAPVHVDTHRRGWLACPRLTIDSRYPMGLFRCWTYAAPTARALVYPCPLDVRGRTATAPSADDGNAVNDRTGDAAFAGHRRFHAGDSPRYIDWKASARTDDLLVVEHNKSYAPTRWFDYHSLADLNREARLSQLAFWIVGAERGGAPYGLRLPDQSLGPAAGPAHYRACLEALALF